MLYAVKDVKSWFQPWTIYHKTKFGSAILFSLFYLKLFESFSRALCVIISLCVLFHARSSCALCSEVTAFKPDFDCEWCLKVNKQVKTTLGVLFPRLMRWRCTTKVLWMRGQIVHFSVGSGSRIRNQHGSRLWDKFWPHFWGQSQGIVLEVPSEEKSQEAGEHLRQLSLTTREPWEWGR